MEFRDRRPVDGVAFALAHSVDLAQFAACRRNKSLCRDTLARVGAATHLEDEFRRGRTSRDVLDKQDQPS